MKIILAIYLILILINYGYIVIHNSIVEQLPEWEQDFKKAKYINIFNPIYFILLNLKNM